MYIAFAMSFVGGVAGACYLVHDGHPWFAVAVLVITSGLSLRHEK